MSESTPTGPTALLIISPLVVLALVLFGAIRCASKASSTWAYFGKWMPRKCSKHRERSCPDHLKDDTETDLETGEIKSLPATLTKIQDITAS